MTRAIYLRRCVRTAPLAGGECRRSVHLGNLYLPAETGSRRSVQTDGLYPYAESMCGVGSLARDLPAAMRVGGTAGGRPMPQGRTSWQFVSSCGSPDPQERANCQFVSIYGIGECAAFLLTQSTCGDACERRRCRAENPQGRTDWRFASPCGIWAPQERTNGRFVSICGTDVGLGQPRARPTCGDVGRLSRRGPANSAGEYILEICIVLRRLKSAARYKRAICTALRNREMPKIRRGVQAARLYLPAETMGANSTASQRGNVGWVTSRRALRLRTNRTTNECLVET